MSSLRFASFSAAVLAALVAQQARADLALPPDVYNFRVIYTGSGGHNLQITTVTIDGSVGVAGTGNVHFSGPGTIRGDVDFAAANTGQFSNSNGSNVLTGTVNYGDTTLNTDITDLGTDSINFGAEAGTALVINGTQTINASTGTLDSKGNEVFNVTSYSSGDGKMLTINGNGHDVVLNFGFNSNVNLGGDVTLNGLNPDQVLWNFDTTGKNISLNNNASSFPIPLMFQGIILAPNDVISLTNANLFGRVFGGDSSDMQIVSGTTILPEPSSVVILSAALLGLIVAAKKRIRS